MATKDCNCSFGLFWMVLIIVAIVNSCDSVDTAEIEKLKKEISRLEKKIETIKRSSYQEVEKVVVKEDVDTVVEKTDVSKVVQTKVEKKPVEKKPKVKYSEKTKFSSGFENF